MVSGFTYEAFVFGAEVLEEEVEGVLRRSPHITVLVVRTWVLSFYVISCE